MQRICYDGGMEKSEPSEWAPKPEVKPELDQYRPDGLFDYARDKQRWLRARVSQAYLPLAIDDLANELERYMTHAFETAPELAIVTRDAYRTRRVLGQHVLAHLIESEPLPLEGDAELYGEHTLHATLYGFYRDTEQSTLRVYVSDSSEARQLPGGVYTPLISVGVEGSDIQFAEASAEEKIRDLKARLYEQLEEWTPASGELIRDFLAVIDQSNKTKVHILHEVSPLITQLTNQKEISLHVIDTLTEIIKLTLRLDTPQDIEVSLYRKVLATSPPAYKLQKGPEVFRGVVPQLGLVGESERQSLGLFFLKDETAFQVPAQFVRRIYESR